MRKLVDFGTTYSVLFSGTASLVSPIVLGFIESRFKDKTVSMVLTLSVVTVGVLCLSTVGEKLIERSARVRKWVLGDDFIEGWWYDISFDAETKSVMHGVLIKIFIDGPEYHINGVGYSPEGHHISTFVSITCGYANKLLFAKYESHTEYFRAGMEHGVMEMQFDSSSSSYSGFYSDYTGKLRSKIQGNRVSAADSKQHNGFQTEDDKKSFIVDKIKKAQAGLSQLRAIKVVD